MEIAVGLYIVGITLIMGYLINKYPRETMSYYIPLHNGAITSCPKIFSTEIVRTTYTQQSKDVWTRNLVLD